MNFFSCFLVGLGLAVLCANLAAEEIAVPAEPLPARQSSPEPPRVEERRSLFDFLFRRSRPQPERLNPVRPDSPLPVRPVPENRIEPEKPMTVKELMQKFEQEREILLKERETERKQIEEQLRTATLEERERLIADLREQQQAWLNDLRNLREEMKDRVNSIREEFRNDERNDLLDEVKREAENVRGRSGRD